MALPATEIVCMTCGKLADLTSSSAANLRAINHVRKHAHTVKTRNPYLRSKNTFTPESVEKADAATVSDE